MKLTEHFDLDEFTRSGVADDNGIDNTPPPEMIPNLIRLANALEIVRSAVKEPILITSGYRCPRLNEIIGSKPTSAHLTGNAADFHVTGLANLTVCRLAVTAFEAAGIRWDRLINEFPRSPAGWIHLGLSDDPAMLCLRYDDAVYRPGFSASGEA